MNNEENQDQDYRTVDGVEEADLQAPKRGIALNFLDQYIFCASNIPSSLSSSDIHDVSSVGDDVSFF
jgi:hypothetical protein